MTRRHANQLCPHLISGLSVQYSQATLFAVHQSALQHHSVCAIQNALQFFLSTLHIEQNQGNFLKLYACS